ncbi:DoxX family protein [Sphingobacteriaceae bacterium]|nr:DoxX family protein [Sphingobacteriaceae bacterium]
MSKKLKVLILYITAFIYAVMGLLHVFLPEKFLFIMPDWMPYQLPLIYISGVAEILLALFLIPRQTRRVSAWLIIAMLVVYLFLIHVPQAIDFYKTDNQNLIWAILRIPLQFVFIYLLWPRKRPSGIKAAD